MAANLNKTLAVDCICAVFCLGFNVKMWLCRAMKAIFCLWDDFCPEQSETPGKLTSGPLRTV